MNDKNKTTYRQQFASQNEAAEYDRSQYAAGSHSDMLWEIEKTQLADILEQFREDHQNVDYLDFAAGTGRIITFMEDKVDSATGIEISQSMVDRANEKLSKATMICTDITADDAEIENKYDFITTFRFILNAEPNLRLRGIKALAARLKDDSSILVFNNHGSMFSYKLLLWPVHKLRSLGKGYQLEGNYFTDKQVRQLADEAGLQIVSKRGCGVLSMRITRLFKFEKVLNFEKKLAKNGLLKKFGVNQMYVAKLKK